MSLNFAAVTPHPPIIIPGVGNQKDLTKVADTVDAMEKIAKGFDEKEVETVIIITPHGSSSKKKFNISGAECFTSSLPGALLSFDGDSELAEKLTDLKDVKKVQSGNLDHGASVPLYFLKEKRSDFKVVPITYSQKSRKKHFDFGKKIFELIKKEEKNIGVIASGDLSHKLTPFAPAGFSKEGKKFDEKLIQLLKKEETKKILEIDQKLIDEAAECGYRSILVLLGILSNIDYESKVLSYEGPFGVGYGVVQYLIKNENQT